MDGISKVTFSEYTTRPRTPKVPAQLNQVKELSKGTFLPLFGYNLRRDTYNSKTDLSSQV